MRRGRLSLAGFPNRGFVDGYRSSVWVSSGACVRLGACLEQPRPRMAGRTDRGGQLGWRSLQGAGPSHGTGPPARLAARQRDWQHQTAGRAFDPTGLGSHQIESGLRCRPAGPGWQRHHTFRAPPHDTAAVSPDWGPAAPIGRECRSLVPGGCRMRGMVGPQTSGQQRQCAAPAPGCGASLPPQSRPAIHAPRAAHPCTEVRWIST